MKTLTYGNYKMLMDILTLTMEKERMISLMVKDLLFVIRLCTSMRELSRKERSMALEEKFITKILSNIVI